MTGRLAGAIPNPSAAAAVAPSLRVVLPVIPSPDPVVAASRALAVLLLAAAVVPNPPGSPSDPASAPRIPEPDNSS
jgi:hypothetical protein